MGEILEINFRENDEKHDNNALMEILQVFRMLSHLDCQSVLCDNAFWRVVWARFSQSVISEIP